MSYRRRLHPDNSLSTYLLVRKLQRDSFNSIAVYKPQDKNTIIGPKTYDHLDPKMNYFGIGIQTKKV